MAWHYDAALGKSRLWTAKEEDDARQQRSTAIFALGVEHGKARTLAEPPEYPARHQLGSMERMTYYDGYASVVPTFQNPYRRNR